MQFEVIRKSHKKEIVIGISLFIILGVVLIARFTFAKYSLVKSIKIAEGTINYKVPDFKIMAMYKQKEGSTCTEDSCYNEMAENEVMPESGYTINESKSYCTLDNINKDTKAKLFTNEDGKHVISGLSKSSKCYLYFDKSTTKKVKTSLGIIDVNLDTPNFNKVCCSDGCEETTVGIYETEDNDGTSYYYRCDVKNNYVKFANKYWRIIRINGDGTVRMIYDGTSAHQNGESTTDSIAVASQKWSHRTATSSYPSYTMDNAYVGLKYTSGQVHGLGTKSNALTQLETWYTNNLSTYAAKIDTNAGFCGDRTPSTSYTTSNGLGGTSSTTTYYGAFIRDREQMNPNLKCTNTSDMYTTNASNKGNKSLTYPIGLITADEVAIAGGRYSNNQYYLYNGQNYWTLSPSQFADFAALFIVQSSGGSAGANVYFEFGIRPVINLRSDTKFTFDGTGEKGTMTNPYIVN